jgi:hypothetical protein
VTAVLGARLALDGLSARKTWVAAGLGLCAIEIASMLERSSEPAYAADRALLGPTLGIVVPLVAYALFEAVYKRERTTALLDPLARHGADRRLLSFGTNGTLAFGCAAITAVFAALTAVSARGFRDPALVADFSASLWGGALVGAAYAGLFALASQFGRRGRIGALVLDWFFGSGAGLFALVWPRAHARSLFGGEPVLDGSQALAVLVLAMMGLVGTIFAAARERR